MNKKYLLGAFVVAMSLMSCEYQKYNSINQKDVRTGNQYVYGVSPDSAARQLKNKYTEKPESQERADKIRAKFFGNGEIAKGN